MDEAARQRYETQSKDLRVKIKAWEVEFYQSHDGKKPSRDDIKTSGMNATYKEYQKLRDILDGKVPLPAPPKTANTNDKESRKRKSPQQPSYTPSTKRFRAVETPSSRHHHALNPLAQFTPGAASAIDTATTPSLSRKLFSPVVPTSIGPTPQRDGRVLGLFDALPFKDADIDSPCKPTAANHNNRPSAVSLSQVIQAGRESMAVAETPRTSARTTDVLGSAAKLGRTPSSRHRRSSRKDASMLATPLKPHDGNNRVAKTPSGTSLSVSKLQFQTPAFLRRIPMPSKTSETTTSPEPIRLPRRKPLLRGLSSVVADLRRLQEEELDDDLDALREMENEGATTTTTTTTTNLRPAQTGPDDAEATAKPSTAKQDEAAILLAEDAQTLLGGFDDEGLYDSPDEANAGLDRSGQPLRVYKKKGQKRTTRRSNMKPVRTRRPAAADDHENEDEDGSAMSSRTRPAPTTTSSQTLVEDDGGEEDPALLSGSEFAASDDEDELAKDISSTKNKTRKTASKAKAPATKGKGKKAATTADEKKPEGTVKKAARKVNELAHANFKRLKLRNNGAKGGAGYNSRFRRRR